MAPDKLQCMDHEGRLCRLQKELSPHRLDYLLVTHFPNIRYLCGFTGSAGVLLVNERGSVFFTDGRYTSQAREEVYGPKVIIARNAPLLAAAQWLNSSRKKAARGAGVMGFEAEHMTVLTRKQLADLLTPAFRLREAPPLVERSRMLKDAEEIDSIRAAVLLGASLFERALATIRPGTKETEVAAELEYAARRAGAQEMSFPTIIAAGQRSALPHGRASEKRIPAEGFVVCDFGVILAGYCSDMTRTVYVGRRTQEARRVYEAVRDAQQAAVNKVRPGIRVGEVDRTARKILRKSGLGPHFTHSTGHGVGLEVHEAPRLAAGQTEMLRPGMVITIEPGVYIPGKWGVRIEDMVLVTEHRCEVLTPTSKDFIAVE